MRDERRRYKRIPFECPITLEIPDGNTYKGQVVDISIHGLLAKVDKGEPALGPVSLSIELAEGEPSFRIEADGEIVRRDPDGYLGIYFMTTDLDSLSHLRRLLELNFGDPDQAKSELDKW